MELAHNWVWKICQASLRDGEEEISRVQADFIIREDVRAHGISADVTTVVTSGNFFCIMFLSR